MLFDIVYVPERTPVMEHALEAGCKVCNGFNMLDVATQANPLLSEDEMQKTFEEYQQAILEQMLSQNKQKEDTFLAANKNQSGIVVTDSGLQYLVLVSSDGKKPAAKDLVTFHYQLKNLNGDILQDSKQNGGEAPTMPRCSTR